MATCIPASFLIAPIMLALKSRFARALQPAISPAHSSTRVVCRFHVIPSAENSVQKKTPAALSIFDPRRMKLCGVCGLRPSYRQKGL